MITIKNTLKVILYFHLIIFTIILSAQYKQLNWILDKYNKNTQKYEICTFTNRYFEEQFDKNNKLLHLAITIREKNEKDTRHFLLSDKEWNLYDQSYFLYWKIDLNNNNFQYVKQYWIENWKNIEVKIDYFNNKIYWKNILDKTFTFYFKYLYSEPFENIYFYYLK